MRGDAPDRGDDGEEEWAFDPEDVGEEGEGTSGRERPPIEPQDVDLENAAFFVLGVAFALVVFAQLLV